MKMTVDIFDERVKKDKEKLANLEAEISALMAQEAELDADMTAAANCGDEALFKAKKAEKEGVSDSIFVKRSFKDRLTSSVTAEDARAAWSMLRKAPVLFVSGLAPLSVFPCPPSQW